MPSNTVKYACNNGKTTCFTVKGYISSTQRNNPLSEDRCSRMVETGIIMPKDNGVRVSLLMRGGTSYLNQVAVYKGKDLFKAIGG